MRPVLRPPSLRAGSSCSCTASVRAAEAQRPQYIQNSGQGRGLQPDDSPDKTSAVVRPQHYYTTTGVVAPKSILGLGRRSVDLDPHEARNANRVEVERRAPGAFLVALVRLSDSGR